MTSPELVALWIDQDASTASAANPGLEENLNSLRADQGRAFGPFS